MTLHFISFEYIYRFVAIIRTNIIKIPMKNNIKQLINGFVILLGAVFLLYSVINESISVYFKVAGLIFIMFGAYRASNHWVAHRDDHLFKDVEEDLEEEELEKDE
jgi:hypothetical protein